MVQGRCELLSRSSASSSGSCGMQMASRPACRFTRDGSTRASLLSGDQFRRGCMAGATRWMRAMRALAEVPSRSLRIVGGRAASAVRGCRIGAAVALLGIARDGLLTTRHGRIASVHDTRRGSRTFNIAEIPLPTAASLRPGTTRDFSRRENGARDGASSVRHRDRSSRAGANRSAAARSRAGTPTGPRSRAAR